MEGDDDLSEAKGEEEEEEEDDDHGGAASGGKLCGIEGHGGSDDKGLL